MQVCCRTIVAASSPLSPYSHTFGRSYEDATDHSAKLFGRARVNFIAQNEALEIFLHPGAHPQEAFRRAVSPQMLLARLFKILRLCTLVAILATASQTAIFLLSHAILTFGPQGDGHPSGLFTASLSKSARERIAPLLYVSR